MYKVLLVDDERIIREGIAAIIEWENHGFTLTGSAQNGIEALEMIKADTPHIVITDIKMPVLDGLALIAEAKKIQPQVIFVVLSGYGEFELANEAMKYGVRHYLLKPCNENKIIEVLDDIRNEIIQRENRDEFLKRNKQNLEKVLPLVREQFFRDFIMNRAYTKTELEYFFGLLGIEKCSIRLLLFRPEGEYEFEEMLALGNIINEVVGLDSVCFSTIVRNQILILMKDVNDDILSELILKVKKTFLYYNGKEVTVSYSESGTFEAAPQMYREAYECLKYSFYLGEGSVITKKDIEPKSEKPANNDLVFDYEKIAFAVKSGNQEDYSKELDSFFQELKTAKCEINLLKTYCMELFLTIIRQCKPEEMDQLGSKAVELMAMNSFDEICEFLRKTGDRLAKANYEGMVKRHSKIASAIIKHINENLENEELSLKWLANEVLFMNVGYLSKLFSKEVGEKFSRYLVKARMEKAKELIEEYGDEKIYEVAQKVGLGDNPQYFSQLFKKYTGLTPTEYKKK